MNRIIIAILLSLLAFSGFCQSNQHAAIKNNQQVKTINKTISVTVYEQMLKKTIGSQLVDVRTQEEYASGHLIGAVDIDFKSPNFNTQIGELDKNKPVFIYCLSGGRSGQAANEMKKMGFREIYNMEGGIIKWNAANKPLASTEGSNDRLKGMTQVEFAKKVYRDNFVLVDFGAKWCGPCKLMLPILESIAKKKKSSLTLLKIDADENPDLLNSKNISSIPYLELYKNGTLVWQHTGYIDEQALLEETKL